MINTRAHILIALMAGMTVWLPLPVSAADSTTAINPEQVVVVVNGAKLTNRDLVAVARDLPRQPVSKEEAMRTMVDRELLYQEAIAKGYDKLPQAAAELSNARREVLSNIAANEILHAQPVTDAETRKLYQDKLANQQLKEYKAHHILVATEAEAKDIINQLNKGADFSALAISKSIDHTSAEHGGDLDWFTPGRMVKPFSDAVATLQKGQYTTQPVQTQFGWHVIRLDDVRNVPIPSYDDVKTRLTVAVENEHIEKHLEDLRQKAKIEMK